MAKIAREKRMVTVVWAAVIALLLAVACMAMNAYGVEEGAASSSSTAAASSASSAATQAEASSSASGAASSTSAESSSVETTASSAAPSESSAASSAGTASGEQAADGAASDAVASGVAAPTWVDTTASRVRRALANEVLHSTDVLTAVDGVSPDTGGSVFTFVTPLESTEIAGDLYWIGNDLELVGSRVGNDIMAGAFTLGLSNAEVKGDVRVAGQSVTLKNTVIQGNADVMALDVRIDARSAANGYYCGGGTVDFKGASKRFIAYGQTIYFDGVVDGDVTLSAQDIIIGPNARITGLLDIRSGQNLATLDIPASAQIARIDTNLDQPNTIDQITQIRAAIAPYFQIGSMLFVVVSFILLGLAALWGIGQKLTEANRLVRRYPLAILVLGCIALMLMFVIIMLGTVLIFTIPLSIMVTLILLISLIFCVPFTGSSLALMLRNRLKRPALCVILGSGLGAVLLFVPYVNQVVLLASLIYFVGYVVNIAMFGHDEKHDASFHARQADEDAPSGKARGILPVAVEVAPELTPEEAAKAADIGPFAVDDVDDDEHEDISRADEQRAAESAVQASEAGFDDGEVPNPVIGLDEAQGDYDPAVDAMADPGEAGFDDGEVPNPVIDRPQDEETPVTDSRADDTAR